MNDQELSRLQLFGWIEIENICDDYSLLKYAQSLGNVLNNPNGKLIDVLKPSNGKDKILGTLSNKYGLGKFPLHTDTAFWITPAQYMMLSSIDVSYCYTYIVSLKSLWDTLSLGEKQISWKSIFRIKTNRKQYFAPLLFGDSDSPCIRYDTSCMTPANDAAVKFSNLFQEFANDLKIEIISWGGNKAVLINNWKVFHGRGSVIEEENRELKRIYIQ